MSNPIIPGFNPDPSICRKGNDFYVATSSFQWFPGVPVYHSKDLKNWELYSYCLTDPDYFDMFRVQDSAGIWAPCLSYADGLFWLIFTVANGSRLNTYECPNYLTTARDPSGPWSQPVYLNSTGNDPSLFHDEDGRKWLVNTQFSVTPGNAGHKGTILQEYSVEEKKLVGKVKNIFPGTGLAAPEGSKLYKHNDWYYIIIAEGGTGYGHQATMARSKNIRGPYEVHPDNPILSARDSEDSLVQRAGHIDIVDVNDDEVAVVYLASRPVNKHSLLGRETFLARASWCEDDWLRLESSVPTLNISEFDIPEVEVDTGFSDNCHDDFDTDQLSPDWNTLRIPIEDRIDLKSRPSWLKLKGTPSCFDSFYKPSIIARRIKHHQFSAETLMDFQAHEPDQWAGIICYYDTRHWYFLGRIYDSDQGEGLMLMGKKFSSIEKLGFIKIDIKQEIILGFDCDGYNFQFKYKPEINKPWNYIGEPVDCLVLSDEFVEDRTEEDPVPTFGFTGGMVGLASYDITERGDVPGFDWFDYQGEDSWPQME